MNVIVPAAGAGRRFKEAGYKDPKPLIDVMGKPMVQRVLESVVPGGSARVVVVVPSGFPDIPGPAHEVLELDHVTDGAARTVLLAIHGKQLDPDAPLLVSNSDQLLDFRVLDFLAEVKDHDGGIVVFPCPDKNPKWSFAQIKDEQVRRVAEKLPISTWATAGVYWWARTADFMRSATEMICRDERTNDEFYVAPTFNEMIRRGLMVSPYFIKESEMHGLGTPEDLGAYLELMKAGGRK